MEAAQLESSNPIVRAASTGYLRYVDRHDDALAKLVLLRAAASARLARANGAWPKSVSEVISLEGGEAGSVEAGAFALAPEGEALRLSLRVRSPLEGQTNELKVVVHAAGTAP